MKTRLLPSSRVGLILILLTGTVPFGFCAEGPQPSPDPFQSKPDALAISGVDNKVADISFGGNPVSQIVEVLAEKFPDVNFVVNDSAKNILVTLRLHSVTLDNIMEALSIATDGKVRCQRVDQNMVSVMGRPIKNEPPALRVYNLSRFLQDKNDKEADAALEELEAVMRLSWQMVQAADPEASNSSFPDLSIHRKTKLLLAVGHERQLEMVTQVVQALESQGGARPGPAVAPPISAH